jgi:hypothetical protein
MAAFGSLTRLPIGSGSDHGDSSITPQGHIDVRLLEAGLKITTGPTVFGVALRQMLTGDIAGHFGSQHVIDRAVVTLHLMGP